MTDENPAYNFRMSRLEKVPHRRIKHKERVYVKGEVHTNTIESAFSLLKRGIMGSFHQVSIKHLQRYLNEFGYRFNRKEDADLFEQTVGRMAGVKPMPYAKLVEETAFTPFAAAFLVRRFFVGLVSERFCGSAFISLPRRESNFCLLTFTPRISLVTGFCPTLGAISTGISNLHA